METRTRRAPYDKTIVVPVKRYMWKALRQISHDKEISMCELVRNAFEKIINKYQPGVDNEE